MHPHIHTHLPAPTRSFANKSNQSADYITVHAGAPPSTAGVLALRRCIWAGRSVQPLSACHLSLGKGPHYSTTTPPLLHRYSTTTPPLMQQAPIAFFASAFTSLHSATSVLAVGGILAGLPHIAVTAHFASSYTRVQLVAGPRSFFYCSPSFRITKVQINQGLSFFFVFIVNCCCCCCCTLLYVIVAVVTFLSSF